MIYGKHFFQPFQSLQAALALGVKMEEFRLKKRLAQCVRLAGVTLMPEATSHFSHYTYFLSQRLTDTSRMRHIQMIYITSINNFCNV